MRRILVGVQERSRVPTGFLFESEIVPEFLSVHDGVSSFPVRRTVDDVERLTTCGVFPVVDEDLTSSRGGGRRIDLLELCRRTYLLPDVFVYGVARSQSASGYPHSRLGNLSGSEDSRHLSSREQQWSNVGSGRGDLDER